MSLSRLIINYLFYLALEGGGSLVSFRVYVMGWVPTCPEMDVDPFDPLILTKKRLMV